MLVAFQALNNITAHRLLVTCCGMPSDHYHHNITNNFEKLLEEENAENISEVATLILLTIGVHIGPTRLLEVGLLNTEYDLEGRLCERCTSADGVMMVKLKRLWLRTMTRMMMKRILEKKLGN